MFRAQWPVAMPVRCPLRRLPLLLVCQGPQYGIENVIKMLADTLAQKPQHEDPVSLEQGVLPTVATVGFGIAQMSCPVQFDCGTPILASSKSSPRCRPAASSTRCSLSGMVAPSSFQLMPPRRTTRWRASGNSRSAKCSRCSVRSVRTTGDRSPRADHRPQHFLYFLPLPQGQGSLRPAFRAC